jgi:hypothetical protein
MLYILIKPLFVPWTRVMLMQGCIKFIMLHETIKVQFITNWSYDLDYPTEGIKRQVHVLVTGRFVQVICLFLVYSYL